MTFSPENPLAEVPESAKELREHRRPVDFGSACETGGSHKAYGQECEDTVYLTPPDRDRFLGVVADGMGGHAMGREASRKAVAVLSGIFERGGSDFTVRQLQQAIVQADRGVRSLAEEALKRETRMPPPGTTLVALAEIDRREGRGWVIANVGDSRAYLVRDNLVKQLTTDQTAAEFYRAKGEKVPPGISDQLVNCLGGKKKAFQAGAIDFIPIIPEGGDVIILASDGLEKGAAFSRDQMGELAGDERLTAAQIADLLALAAAGAESDDVSVAVIKF